MTNSSFLACELYDFQWKRGKTFYINSKKGFDVKAFFD